MPNLGQYQRSIQAHGGCSGCLANPQRLTSPIICTSKRKWAQAPLLERLVAFLSKSSFLLPLEKPPDIFVPLQQQGPSSTNLKARPIALVRLGMEAIFVEWKEFSMSLQPPRSTEQNGLLPQADAPEPLTWITTCYTKNCPRPVGTKKVATPKMTITKRKTSTRTRTRLLQPKSRTGGKQVTFYHASHITFRTFPILQTRNGVFRNRPPC